MLRLRPETAGRLLVALSHNELRPQIAKAQRTKRNNVEIPEITLEMKEAS